MGIMESLISAGYTLGADVASPQGKIDFKDWAAKMPDLKFVCSKSSEKNWGDPNWQYNFKESKAAGFITGSYHVIRDDGDPIAQAQFYFERAKNTDMPLAADFETCRTNMANAATNCLRFMEKLKELSGKLPLVYSYPSFINSIQPDIRDNFIKYPLWVANYNVSSPSIPSPWADYADHSQHLGLATGATAWQFDGDGGYRLPSGVDVDYDIFYMGLDQFKQWCANPTVAKPFLTTSSNRGIQSVLNYFGCNCGTVDGSFGPKTYTALGQFQTKYGLPVTKKADADTLSKMNSLIALL